jgi:geranylgeranyl reductase family protein
VEKYDVIIVGGGPAGASSALCLTDAGIRVLLLDREIFPRDKICGDALSVDVLNQLPLLSSQLALAFDSAVFKLPSFGVTLFSPDHTSVEIPFVHQGQEKCGYTCSREDFDNLLFQQVKHSPYIDVRENCLVEKIVYGQHDVSVYTSLGLFQSAMIIGADGANSLVRRSFKPGPVHRAHHSAGLRMYFEGVTSFHEKNYIELHFFKDILPGYLWIFPMTGNRANVGIGVLSSVVSRKKINLKETLQQLLHTVPHLKERFASARAMEKVKGFGLPLGSEKRAVSGDRFLLAGDAAGLIDPFSGEGIGNAIRSGRVAAGHIIRCFEKQDFTAGFNKAYDAEIYKRMGNEFRLSRALQRLCRYPVLFNFVIKKAANSKYWSKFLTEALADPNQKKRFLSPAFYYRLLFK